jgi:dolichyl-phosphate beta-glucosyltransferase
VSVIIPAYNEERNITATLAALVAFLDRQAFPYQVIVVDDGSRDRTGDLAEAFSVNHPAVTLIRSDRNHGKGGAVRTGMLAAAGDFLFFMDADLSYPVADLEKMLAALKGGADVVIGSRALAESHMEVRPPLRRYLAGRIYSLMIQALLFRSIPDTQCGFKGFRREVARRLFAKLTLEGFAFDVELLFLVRKFGYRLAMVPMRLTFVRETSKVRLVAHSVQMFADLVKIRLNALRGRYG